MSLKKKLGFILGLILCLTCSIALADASYQELCQQQKLTNPDIIAWVEIPGASYCEPVMRHPTDDSYYAKNGADGEANLYGSLYVQAKYNAADFSDPVTLIYGSSALNSAPLGLLQELYSGRYDRCRTLYLHMPEETHEYEVFAAIPYASIHILHYYDFRDAGRYESFFNSVFSTRALGMHLDEDKKPEPEKDQVLILSTGLRGDTLQRYLVMAKRVTQTPVK